MTVPVIETERLRLRGHCAEDCADCAAMGADPQVTRYIGGKPSTPPQSWGRILSYAGLW
jgi:RimJ/RimL family protein N-acetyltransferase